jgi:hypothetical protein
MPEAAYLFCPRCVIGHCDPDKTTLVRLYGETVISIQTIVQDNTHTFFYKALPLDAQESHSTRRLKS